MEASSLVGVLAGAALTSFVISFYIRRFALKKGIIQKVRQRDFHKKPIPRLGGVGIFIAFWATVLVISISNPEFFNFNNQKVYGIDKNLLGVMAGSLIIFTVMLIDDVKGLKWGWKLAAQFSSALAVALSGVTINSLSSTFSDILRLDKVAFSVNGYEFLWGQIFIIIWIVLVMNIVNWLDGLDGLAGGIVMITAIALYFLAVSPRIDQVATGLLALILAGSIFGFMPFNWHPAKMFLGDTGSMFLGYILAILAVISGGKVATASLIMGIPLLDAVWVVGSRMSHHKSPFEADQNHLHHRLLRAGFTVKQVVVLLYGASIVFGYLALQSGPEGKFWASIWLVVIMVLLSMGLAALEWARRTKLTKK